ncbi:MAG TPA: acyl-[ACP]--phospholipid O-acyltransferase [Candidatus Hydrogenedentes bacterium]|nr:acyl-[ACP]--phospholipid O-acyltransferase [Candidatus Hydrogenedentota bacterium]HOV72906.1 acyl-[ACP]--phospholipid O-acyltransferase [Candidatus Hydrogenedentota bacterium]HPC18222.1 acyl-[ACP]--phospholipid O-acyltransferase [Candidatus Hydrogenedentota bacterium]HRT21873.1 acyl-[ACP]--phospholipid O-acyltransferase [Candidatus Hydrogenedentota bacterium]HRT66615.1 acyl-[ACP]--phospholipid O-acyltransferase [Candidatus Hydrogenedentota bacterium]
MVASKGMPSGKPYSMKGFWALIATQFQGAFNDNLFQFLIQFTILGVLIGPGKTADESTATMVTAVSTIIFSLPFLVFPGVAGALSDRYSKQFIAVCVKVWEIFIVCFGFFAFYLESPAFLWVMLFFMATHSAFFSPAKYGILPEILEESQLSWGNGVLQMWTIIAIIAGTGAAGPLHSALGGKTYLATFVLLFLSCAGLVMAQYISKPPAANPAQPIRLNPMQGMIEHFRIMKKDRWLLYTVVGYTYFWFAGALLRANVFAYGAANLHLSETQISAVLAALAVGIGVGALAAGYLSRQKIELGLVPMGVLGIALFSGLLAMPDMSFWTCLILLFGLGCASGVFDVPLAATLQQRSPNHIKGGIMATTNMLTFVGMLGAGALYWALTRAGVNTRQVFMLNAVFSLAVGLYMCWRLPILVIRFLLWLVTNTVYRVSVIGRPNFPITGGGLLVANHTSYIDPIMLQAVVDRPIRFLMYRGYYEMKWMRPIARIMNAIPVSAADSPAELRRSLKEAADTIKNGELVCVFAEGEITRTGQLQSFRKGFELIMRGIDAPIIPVHIDRLWGSVFSFSEGRFFWKKPKEFPYRTTVSFGTPMPADTSGPVLRSIIQEMGAEAFAARKMKPCLVDRAFLKAARRRPKLMAIADSRSGELSYFKTLAGSIVLARKLRAILDKQPMVGVLVPPSVGGCLTNLALEFMGRVPINLNYTASAQAMESYARQCKLSHCITAKAFLERLPVTVPGIPVYLEDIMKSVTTADRVIGGLLAKACPGWLLGFLLGAPRRTAEDLVTVIFSSGSEGDPKGVMLTHGNILHNVDSLAQIIAHKDGDVMMAMLPLFHSFGFMGTIWAPLINNLSVVYHPTPLEPKAIGNLIKKYKAEFFISTPTFLQNFTRRCDPDDMKSLRYLLVGAEKLTDRVRDAFMEKFGVEPLEGYGATECSPAISSNIPDFHGDGHHQIGMKRGTVGRPMPGIAVRVIDPDTGEILGCGQPGLLQVKGPNVMKGYLGMPEKTAAVLKDGWYSTGDIASVDEDGFITLTDRLARFSKIAGEMVSHTKIEDTLHNLIGLTEQALAVTGVPDAARGERLIVIHTLSDDQLAQLLRAMDKCEELPNLWRPRPNAFYRVEAIPVLGTGKMDIKSVKAMARAFDAGDL